MRLINADEFKKQIAGMAIINNYPPEKANKLCELIDSQLTAYDVDKVVEWLEILSDSADAKIIMEQDDLEQYWDGFRDGIDKAIEIVKSGGIT